MRIHVSAVGRMRPGPERALWEDYAARALRTGRAVGITALTLQELPEARAPGPGAEDAALLRSLPEGAALCALDERGRMLDSPGLAALLAGWRDAGRGTAAFVIGGADGLGPALRERAEVLLSLGPMVWPHMLVRVMLAEQLYRAMTILAGLPYHRGG